jgi:hypothetical protein
MFGVALIVEVAVGAVEAAVACARTPPHYVQCARVGPQCSQFFPPKRTPNNSHNLRIPLKT